MGKSTYVVRAANVLERTPGGTAGRLSACSACAGDYEDPERTAAPRDAEDAAVADGEEAGETSWPADVVEDD